MPDQRRRKRPLLVLCAAVTLDGKLDAPPAWEDATWWDPPVRETFSMVLVDDEAAATLPPSMDWLRPHWIVVEPNALPLDRLYRLGSEANVRRLLCFGGATLFRAFLEARLVDEIRLLVRPRIDGRRDSPTLSGPPTPEFFPRSFACRLLRMETLGGEWLLHYRVLRRARQATRSG